jgi:hypothetical protein
MIAIAFGVDLAVGKSTLWKIMLLIFMVSNGIFFMASMNEYNKEIDRIYSPVVPVKKEESTQEPVVEEKKKKDEPVFVGRVR